MTLSLRYAARSDVGLVRASNQDSAYAGPSLLVVADGMGGHAGGDIASRIAIEALRDLDTEDHTPESALADLESAVETARQGLVRASTVEPDLAGMGTTVTALLRTGSTLVMAHMGDSRAYLLRDGALTQVTVDHTFVQHLVDTGRISPDEAEHHPQRNVVMRVLSDFDVDLHPDMSVREAKPGDRWMLCSDGLSGFVNIDLIGEILSDARDPGEAADLLLLAAMQANSTDNITVVVADVVDDSSELPADAADDPADDPGLPAAADSGVGGVQVVGAATGTDPIPGLPVLPVLPDGAGAVPSSDDDTGAAGADADAAGPADADSSGIGIGIGIGVDADDDAADDDPDDADARPAPRRHPVIASLVAVLVVALVGAGGWAGYRWTQQQYYVGVSDDQVAIFRGIPASAGPITLSTPVELTGTRVSELPPFFINRLEETIRASSEQDARDRAERLIEQAREAQDSLAPAEPTGSPSPTTSPSPTRSPTPTPDSTPDAEPASDAPADGDAGAGPAQVAVPGTVPATLAGAARAEAAR